MTLVHMTYEAERTMDVHTHNKKAPNARVKVNHIKTLYAKCRARLEGLKTSPTSDSN